LLDIQLWHWVAFGGLIACLLALDLLLFHRRAHEPSLWESAGWTLFWIVLSLAFNGLVWYAFGREAGVDFLTGYLVEKSLSMDNLFVFVVIFRYFQVPVMYHYRVLFWGIVGAIFLRLGFILAGAELLRHFDWIMVLLGLFLLYTAFRLGATKETEVHPQNNLVLKAARRVFPIATGDHREHGSRFFVREHGRIHITPLFLVILVVESTDVLFAVDSVPAIFGITKEPFIVFTSNIFAILGLRALYFLLAGMVGKFRYLRYGLAAVLGLVGVKMIVEFVAGRFWGCEERIVPPWASLVVVAALLSAAALASMIASRREGRGP
jgi:tellurite resistance protein TerC